MTVMDALREQRPLRRIRWIVSRPTVIVRRRGKVGSQPASATSDLQPTRALGQPHVCIPAIKDALSQLNDSIERASKSIAAIFIKPGIGLSAQISCKGFPLSLQPNTSESSASPQTLISTGSKEFVSRWDPQGILRVKIYDFALYANHSHVTAKFSSHRPQDASAAPITSPQNSSHTLQRPRRLLIFPRPAAHGNRRKRRSRKHQQPGLPERVRAASGDVAMSLCVRPARDLPLLMLRAEYARVLRRRMRAVGGSPEDAAVRSLLSYFNAAMLPPHATRRGCIRRGSVVQFSRSRSGYLCTTANGDPVATVHSPKLCEAVFDLYLGEAPVSRTAKMQARVALERMLGMHAKPSAAVAPSALPSRRLNVTV